jgi:hypothetical protein
MTPSVWQKLDELRGSVSRGVWIASRVNRDYNHREARDDYQTSSS